MCTAAMSGLVINWIHRLIAQFSIECDVVADVAKVEEMHGDSRAEGGQDRGWSLIYSEYCEGKEEPF